MKLAIWIFRLALFVVLFSLALNNTREVTLNVLFGYSWHAPLILFLLLFFAAGALLGLLTAVPLLLRQRLRVRGLRRTSPPASAAAGRNEPPAVP